jgi:hypothetical protein
MPELMEEVVAFIERRTAELNEREDGAAPRPTESVVPAASIATSSRQCSIGAVRRGFHLGMMASGTGTSIIGTTGLSSLRKAHCNLLGGQSTPGLND